MEYLEILNEILGTKYQQYTLSNKDNFLITYIKHHNVIDEQSYSKLGNKFIQEQRTLALALKVLNKLDCLGKVSLVQYHSYVYNDKSYKIQDITFSFDLPFNTDIRNNLFASSYANEMINKTVDYINQI